MTRPPIVKLARTKTDAFDRACVLDRQARRCAGDAFDHFCDWIREVTLIPYPIDLGHRISMGCAERDADDALLLLAMHAGIKGFGWVCSWKREERS